MDEYRAAALNPDAMRVLVDAGRTEAGAAPAAAEA
jgi:hypothetical protein